MHDRLMKLVAGLSLALVLLSLCAKSSQATPAAQDPKAAVARIDGTVVTEGDLAAEVKVPLAAAEARFAEESWGIRRRGLDALVERRLLDAKAKKEGVTVDALVAREITSKVGEPDEAQLQSVYDQTKASGRQLPPFPEVRAEIARYLKGEQTQQVRQEYIARLKAEAKVQITFPPYLPNRVDVKAEGPSKGSPDAPVTIVEFSDYECSYCAGAEVTVKRVLEAYPGKVRLVYRDLPLSIHPHAPKAAEAAHCAGEQQRYWDMHDVLFANQRALKVDDLKAHARKLGLDAAKFDACLDSGRMAGKVDADRKAGEALGLDGTPTFFVDGRPYVGGRPFEAFQEVIDHTLSNKR
jgi:protein-disulfide isomerase